MFGRISREISDWHRCVVMHFPGKWGDAIREGYFRKRVKSCGTIPRFAYNSWIVEAGNLTLGDHVEIAWDTFLDATGGITIGDWSGVGPGTALLTTGWVPDEAASGPGGGAKTSRPIVIGKDVWLGANCVINMGVTVGDGAIVSAGSVVSKDVPPYAMISGNPGRVIGWRKAPSAEPVTEAKGQSRA